MYVSQALKPHAPPPTHTHTHTHPHNIAMHSGAGFLLVHYEQKLAHLASDEMFGTVYKAPMHTRQLLA